MKAAKVWIAVAAVALTVGAGACGGAGKSSAQRSTTVTTQAAASKSSTPAAPSSNSGTAVASSKTAGTKSSTATTLSPQAVAQMVLGINAQIQKAESSTNGPTALTPAQAQAIVNAQDKALGIPVPKQ